MFSSELGYLRGMRVKVMAALVVSPAVAFAQAAPTETEKTWSEVQQQAAQADSAQDCAIACRALESLARATRHLCELGPEHCDEARAKLREATERVRAACPDCAATGATPTTEPRTAPSDQLVSAGATSTAPERGRGGCASCTTTDSASDVASGLFAPTLTALAILALRKKQRRV